ncbi:MAG: hypothetical protein ABIA04_00135 [Pseudomonadota bacterium]
MKKLQGTKQFLTIIILLITNSFFILNCGSAGNNLGINLEEKETYFEEIILEEYVESGTEVTFNFKNASPQPASQPSTQDVSLAIHAGSDLDNLGETVVTASFNSDATYATTLQAQDYVAVATLIYNTETIVIKKVFTVGSTAITVTMEYFYGTNETAPAKPAITRAVATDVSVTEHSVMFSGFPTICYQKASSTLAGKVYIDFTGISELVTVHGYNIEDLSWRTEIEVSEIAALRIARANNTPRGQDSNVFDELVESADLETDSVNVEIVLFVEDLNDDNVSEASITYSEIVTSEFFCN